MPAELPGFYWDEERNRYFPLSSRPKTTLTPTVAPVAAHPPEGPRNFLSTHGRRRRPHALWDLTETLRNTVNYSKRYTLNHDILSEHYARTSSLKNSIVPTFGTIKSFNTTIVDGQCRQFIGDSHGWLYSSTFDVEADWNTTSWSAELNLQFDSEISTICISGNNCAATCFGSTTRFSLMDLSDPARTSLFRLNSVYDVRAAHLEGSSLALGAKSKAIYVSDINVFPPVQVLDTQSDVFSIYKQTDLVYTGSRNGSIRRFDLRIGKPRGQPLFDPRNEVSSPVLHLSVIRDFEMLLSRMNGDLATYDLRFLRLNHPIFRFPEHINTITQKLGIAVDPSEEFLFAAGEDRRIRGCFILIIAPPEPIFIVKLQSYYAATYAIDDVRKLNNDIDIRPR
ncbi:hypothetical protein BDN72DRAFT_875735 [Pluteus cervinus]|uniref:Uncharacterized protein n=1 Tax=Pluteus cervinus TaxID=181527 RepID=A0ACD3B9G3_9AGAR|nr:hypothetical protein BDN72DRAFT_875735 [Pluteus cervinus]